MASWVQKEKPAAPVKKRKVNRLDHCYEKLHLSCTINAFDGNVWHHLRGDYLVKNRPKFYDTELVRTPRCPIQSLDCNGANSDKRELPSH